MPEQDGENLYTILTTLFTLILNHKPDAPVILDTAHRSLRRKSATGDTPRDIICRVHYYALKEDVLKHLRDTSAPMRFQGHEIQIYQDLSWHTLQARRALRPITDQLRMRNLRYRWGYPFALIVNTRGTTFTISTHQDITPFTKALNLTETNILDWYALDPALTAPSAQQRPRWRSPAKRQRLAHAGHIPQGAGGQNNTIEH
ncbi:Hypothetical predicted protein [Pelobates cultripes]|uniref:Uncharacterized protein n=1 Tax=Pelobates cultripes TaxID=61616 RepID=A0AAD1RMN0_PELCU|nr:Hypothetical predicted protein [Pelobates cultripes]